MRILFVTPYVPSLIRVRPYNFIRALAARHEVSLLTTDVPREEVAADRLRALCREVEFVPLRPASVARSCASAALKGQPLQAAFCRSAEFTRRLEWMLRRGQFDIVHVEHLRAAHVTSALPLTLPSLYDAVDCISLLWEHTARSTHSLRQRLLATVELGRTRAYEARTLSRFDKVAVTSPVDGRALRGLAPEADINVVPNGVDLEYFRPLPGQHEQATLIFSGKISYHANTTAILHFVERIFPAVRARQPSVQLRVVGSRPPKVVRSLARDSAISVTCYLPDIRPAVGQATVAVCPVTVKVGIQNKVLEAMGMGVPVVSTREGIQGLMVEPGRDLLVADSPAEFAAHVCRLLEDPVLCNSIGMAGRRYVEAHHRWDVAARRLEQLYEEAIASHNELTTTIFWPRQETGRQIV
ncbi:MAG: glycosyltransferase [Dehalococcoidales bacterium]|nr:glycosyltransferase [Dehalococcoidales bacterium]